MSKTGPIIITGMHRSGTSLLSEILMKQGVFMGSKLDSNSESVFFQRIKEVKSSTYTASLVHWKPIHTEIVTH